MEHSDRRMGNGFKMNESVLEWTNIRLFYNKDGGTLEQVNALSLKVFGIRLPLINLN